MGLNVAGLNVAGMNVGGINLSGVGGAAGGPGGMGAGLGGAGVGASNPPSARKAGLDGWINSLNVGQIEIVPQTLVEEIETMELSREFNKGKINSMNEKDFQTELQDVLGQAALNAIFGELI